jgi:nitroimidazol reductase NimA-like FMN-containing flavoprotein (pyridoxamine 5'-phosphate oxidase superfamily)
MVAEPMSDDEVDAVLRSHGVGVLSLADAGETYAVPESFGYDGRDLYFQFVSEPGSQKLAFVRTTDAATLTVFETDPARSVVVRGRVERVPEDERSVAAAAVAANATIPTLNTSPDTPTENLDVSFYRLVPETVTGRRFALRAPATSES